MQTRFTRIVLAEDNPDDRRLIQRAFRNAGVETEWVCESDGEAVIAYYQARIQSGDLPVPQPPELLLLDTKLPRVEGPEIGRWLRNQPELASLRIVQMTSVPEMIGADSFPHASLCADKEELFRDPRSFLSKLSSAP